MVKGLAHDDEVEGEMIVMGRCLECCPNNGFAGVKTLPIMIDGVPQKRVKFTLTEEQEIIDTLVRQNDIDEGLYLELSNGIKKRFEGNYIWVGNDSGSSLRGGEDGEWVSIN
tara:strand:- start:824 stop:1159 length:336 start_codon:yes stop_codon:yes gene_type:complete